MNSDPELLRGYLNDGAEASFSALVARQINFVYACALRQVGGDAHLAEEVTQSVFLDLARKARVLARRPSITGWLYTSTRYAAAKARRTRSRRQHHETQAHDMEEITAMHSRQEIEWDELRPVIDEAMHELPERDREAILQRYFEGRPFVEVGLAIGLPENSARMRVERALEKLRERLTKRGITSTAAALAAVLANQPLMAAPCGLAASTASASIAGAAAGSAAAAWFQATNLMNMISFKAGTACLVICASGVGVYQMNQARVDARRDLATLKEISTRQTRELAVLREENKRLNTAVARGPATTSRQAVPGSRFSADELRQQVIGAFRAASVTEAFMQIAGVFQHITPANWRGALLAFDDARKNGENLGPAWELFARRAGETVGKESVEYFVGANDLEAARFALTGWASANPAAALEWIGKEASAETRQLIVGAAIRGLALAEPDLAVTAIEGIPIDRRKNYVLDFVPQLVRGAGMAQTGEIVNGIIQRAAANGQASDDYVKRIFADYAEIRARRAAASGDVAELAVWVKTHVNQPYSDNSLVWGTAAQIAQTSVPHALAWLDALHAAGPVGEAGNPMGYGMVLATWANQEGIPAVARWLDAHTHHPRYDNIVGQYTTFLAERSEEQATRLAGTIKSAMVRDAAFKKIAEVAAKRRGP